MVELRKASTQDAEQLLEIYGPYITDTAYTFETELPSVEEFQGRMNKYMARYPWIVAVEGEQIKGYVYASLHRDREAYQWTCECSVYLREEWKGKGLGKLLYDGLFELLKMQGFRNVYAGITKPNDASERMHQKCGFEEFAVYENVGMKFDVWHHVGWWKLRLNEYDPSPPPPTDFPRLEQQAVKTILDRTAAALNAKLMNS